MTLIRSAFLVLLLLLTSPSFAQNFGQLSGRIMDSSSGEGIENVAVQLSDRVAFTDSEGAYRLLGIPAGSYDVFMARDGYAALQIMEVLIGGAYQSVLDVDLKSEGESYASDEPIEPEYVKIGSFTAFSAENIRRMPVRDLSEIVRTAPGVVSYDGFDELFVRGGNARELVYFLDGMKVSGLTGLTLPQTAIEQVTFEPDPLTGQYGDALSGIVHVTTKTGMEKLYGTFEGFTSEALDPFGHTYLSGSVGGPLIKDKIGIAISGEYTDQLDSNPRSVGELYLSDEVLDDLRTAPMAFMGQLPDGLMQLLPIPATLSDGAELLVDTNGIPLVSNGAISFSDGTTVALQGVDASTLNLDPVLRANFVEDFEIREAKRKRQLEQLTLHGSVTLQPISGSRLRVGGRLNQVERDESEVELRRQVLFAPEGIRSRDINAYDVFASFSQRFSNTGLIHLHASYSDIQQEVYDARFGTGWEDLLEYGNLDNDVFSTLQGYLVRTIFDPPIYETIYSDGFGSFTADVHNLVQLPGGGVNTYNQSRTEQLRFSGNATFVIGNHHVSLGGEYEKQTHRYVEVNAPRLARFITDDDVDITIPGMEGGLQAYADFPLNVIEDLVGSRYGYDVRGQNEVNGDDVTAFYNQENGKPIASYDIAPYEPIFFGGYIEDTFSLSDLQFHAGLRVDVFDNNNRVLRDPFGFRPLCRVEDFDVELFCGPSPAMIPPSIGDDFAVYYSGNTIVGYRDTDGNYYDADGQATPGERVVFSGQIRHLSSLPEEDMFRPYKRRVMLMPRVGARFLVDDKTTIFARFGISSQRPLFSSVVTLQSYLAQRVGNQDIAPITKTFIEIGGHYQQDGAGLFSLAGFFNNVEDGAISTSKGIELQFTSERKNGFLAHLDYTLSFAEGTYLGDGIFTSFDTRVPEQTNTLDFDQRHTINLLADYRLGKGEGPKIGSVPVLENLGVNVRVRAGSGFPYTPTEFPIFHGLNRPPVPIAGINSLRTPWTVRVDLQVERRFYVTSMASVSAFIWVQNLFDQTNVNQVWDFTGEHDDDGYLSSEAGQTFLSQLPAGAGDVYNHLSRVPEWVGIPRLIRVGVRVDF